MYVAAYKRPQIQPIQFLLAETGEATPNFRAGACVCKACESTNLTHYPPVNDAKCYSCGQWQNEDLNPT
jgi:hypothetical protein